VRHLQQQVQKQQRQQQQQQQQLPSLKLAKIQQGILDQPKIKQEYADLPEIQATPPEIHFFSRTHQKCNGPTKNTKTKKRPTKNTMVPLQIKVFCDSRCPFGQIYNRKQNLGRFRSHFQTKFLTGGLKEDANAFLFLKVTPHRSLMVKDYG
jgi:hypothetical protein